MAISSLKKRASRDNLAGDAPQMCLFSACGDDGAFLCHYSLILSSAPRLGVFVGIKMGAGMSKQNNHEWH